MLPTLDWLIDPHKKAWFETVVWEQTPLAIHRSAPEKYDQVLTMNDLEFLCKSAHSLDPQCIDLIGMGKPAVFPMTLEAINVLMKKGRTLRLRSVQRFSKTVYALSSHLEQELAFPVNVNLYYSPEASTAIGRHYDSHDVFILQISGRKRWRVCEPAVVLPLEYMPTLHCEPRTRIEYGRFKERQANAYPNDL